MSDDQLDQLMQALMMQQVVTAALLHEVLRLSAAATGDATSAVRETSQSMNRFIDGLKMPRLRDDPNWEMVKEQARRSVDEGGAVFLRHQQGPGRTSTPN